MLRCAQEVSPGVGGESSKTRPMNVVLSLVRYGVYLVSTTIGSATPKSIRFSVLIEYQFLYNLIEIKDSNLNNRPSWQLV